MITQFLDSHGFLDYAERGLGSDENNNNLLDKLQDAIGRGQNPMSILPSSLVEPEIITISDPGVGISGSGAKYTYDRFPSNNRTEEQKEKRKQILAAASGAFDYSGSRHTPSSPSVLVGKDKAESLSPRERAAERERMVLDIKVKLQGLWLRLLKLGATDDPLSSFEYGTILALIESDAEGIGGSGFVECIREHIHSGWQCHLTEEQFIAVKELVCLCLVKLPKELFWSSSEIIDHLFLHCPIALGLWQRIFLQLKTAIGRATSRNDMPTIRDALEVSAEMYKKDANNVPDYVQRHLISLSIWEELRYAPFHFLPVSIVSIIHVLINVHFCRMGLGVKYRFWEGYFDYLMDRSSNKSTNYATQVTTQLILVASHMAGLGLHDNDAWYMIETIAEKNNIGNKQFVSQICFPVFAIMLEFALNGQWLVPLLINVSAPWFGSLWRVPRAWPWKIKLRGFLSHVQQLRISYWGISSVKAQSMSSFGLPSPHSHDSTDDDQQPAEASGVGRSWVQSMFSRDTTSRTNSFSRVRRWTSDSGTLAANENGTPRKQDLSSFGQKKIQTSVRMLRGHSGAVTALHCVTRREVWDLVGDREDAGFFISGSTDCLVKLCI
ncbi:DENN domain and WD repeat-containing protein SCD1 [Vitis vinifera]|uniref:DENN domain and WD repeat-containing protein SCD1 n=1 Tax=Vitis vinifera TaxID=29760 RepID=A0A438JYZ7_VITVI|nr:DENN domain and WD repeat-containing protein SCD1 [Vitis vinifera]